MGQMKRWLEERQERGWDALGKAMCPDCLTDPALKSLAAENLDEDCCDYCGRQGENVACDTDVIMTRIGEGFAEEFSDPINVLYHDSGEGGYQGDVFDTSDVVARIEETIGVDDFVTDVIEAYGAKEWCDREPYVTPRHESLLYSWDKFAEIVKYESRYLFLNRPAEEFPEPHEVAPGEMLEALGALVEEADVFDLLAADTVLFRARPGSPGALVANAEELGTAPRDAAFSNRMSPPGIALFYGAFDPETAAREAWGGPKPGEEEVTIARFTNSAPLRVLDLASLPGVPTLFDESRHLRATLRFLHAFSDLVSGAVRTAPRSVREFVEYVPTQIVSEFFRTAYESEGTTLDGIIYGSAEHDGGVCCALFIPPERCLDRGAWLGEAPALVLQDWEVWTALR